MQQIWEANLTAKKSSLELADEGDRKLFSDGKRYKAVSHRCGRVV
jgi:hypothetical protein